MGERIGRAERQNGECDGCARQPLNNVVNGAVAAAGKDGIAACGDRVTRVDRSLLAGAAYGEIGVNAGRLDDADGDIEFAVAPFAFAAGIRIKQNCSFAHARCFGDTVSASFQFSVWKIVLCGPHIKSGHVPSR